MVTFQAVKQPQSSIESGAIYASESCIRSICSYSEVDMAVNSLLESEPCVFTELW